MIENLKKTLLSSNLILEIEQSLNGVQFEFIRCLALGQPSVSIAAKYQLALLLILQEKYNAKVSIYDPIFNSEDVQFLQDFTIEEEYTPKADTLYFLPHASLEVTESLLERELPKYLLCNDVITHTDRLTKKKLNDLYPILSSMVYLLGDATSCDGFIPVKKKTRSKFIEPVIDYHLQDLYFQKVDQTRFDNVKNDLWGNSFSDLAYHQLS